MAPNALTIHSIALQFVQTFTVTYSDGKAVEMPVERLPTLPVASKCVPGSILAFDVPEDASAKPDPVPLTELQPGREYTHVKTVRAPNDDKVRPSTLEGCNHQVDVRHKIEVRIQYRLPGDKGLRHLTISRPCVIASVSCRNLEYAYQAPDPRVCSAALLEPTLFYQLTVSHCFLSARKGKRLIDSEFQLPRTRPLSQNPS